MLINRIVPKSTAQLDAMARPVDPRQPEALPYVLYDTQLYDSAATTSLTFFAGTNSDQTLTNQESAGGLPAGQRFEVNRVFLDILSRPSVNAAATALGQLDDIALLLHTARATLTFSMASKTLGPIPATFFGRSGGPVGDIASGTFTAPVFISAGHVEHTGGFPVNGTMIILPVTRFGWTMNFAAAQTLAGGDTYIRVSMLGVLHRRVS